MSDQKISWNNTNKKRKKKRPYKNKSYSKNTNRKENNEKYKNHSKPLKISQNDFPSLKSEHKSNNNSNNDSFKVQNTYNSLVWRKNSDNSDNSDNSLKDTIYTKAKNGSLLFNSYPVLDDTFNFPLFQ